MLLWNRVAVVGVPGVGKTTLCKAINKKLGYHYINYGELMLEIAIEKDLAHTMEFMLQLKPELQFQIWESAAFSILNVKNLLIDLHGVDLTREGYLISLPFEIIPPEIIIIIEASYDEIFQRRCKDVVKNRVLEDYKSVKEHMSLLKYSMSSISTILGSNLMILKNDDFQTCLKHLEAVLR
jgi:adenylate kinase